MTPPKTPKTAPLPPTAPGSSVYRKYRVVLKAKESILGGIPLGLDKDPLGDKTVMDEMKTPEANEKVKAAKVPKAPPHATFLTIGGHPFIEERNVKGLLKEASQTLYGRTKQSTITQKLITRAVFVEPVKIPLVDDEGKPCELKTLRRPVHAMTMQGPRTSLQDVDYVEKAVVSFVLKVAAPEIDEGVLRQFLELAADQGLGAVRTQGFGKFDIVKVESL